MRKFAAITLILLAGNVLAQSARLRGRVMDSSGSVMPEAHVKVYRADQVVKEGVTSIAGDFEISVDPGEYKVEITAQDFQPYVQNVNLTPNLGPLAVTMKVAQLQQAVEVITTGNQVSIESDSSLKTTILQNEFVDTLPDETDDLVTYLQEVAGSRGEAGADTMFVIDGFTEGRIPPKDQIQEIRINNNPFSAEFSGVGFTRTEIVTKAGTGDFHGNVNFLFRDAALNARNPFALTRPPYQQRNFNSTLSGPVIANKFTLNMNFRNNENEVSDSVRAILPTGQVSQAVVMPNKNRAANARGQWALNPNNTIIFNLDYQLIDNRNQGIGGFTLQERAFTRHAQNTEYQLRETAVLSKRLVHEGRFSYRRDYGRQDPITQGLAVDVLDAFSSGANPNKRTDDNRSIEFSDVWMYSSGRWSFKSGGQFVHRLHGNIDYTNFDGTYTFSNLPDYLAGHPVSFTQNQGTHIVPDTQIEAAAFFQSDWKASRNLNLSLGGRYETQTNISVHNVDPRLGFAYQVTNTLVLRGGIGTFHQRMAQFIMDQLTRLDGVHQKQIVICPQLRGKPDECLDALSKTSLDPDEVQYPCYPDPFAPDCLLPLPPSVRAKSPVLRTPYNFISDISVEKTLPKGLGLTFSWDQSRGLHLYRGRDSNAPLPIFHVRPNPLAGNIVQIESSAGSRSNNFTFGFRQTLRNKWNLNAFGNYTLGWNYNDTDGNFSLPENNYDMRDEWGRAPLDQRHRFVAGVTFRTFWNVGVNTNLQANSNRPYNIITGSDDNGDTTVNDRPPGTKRNAGIGPGYFNVNMSLQKVVRLKSETGRSSANPSAGPNMTFMVNLWNALNHPQYVNYSGVMTSPFFGRPNRANNPRNIELGARFSF